MLLLVWLGCFYGSIGHQCPSGTVWDDGDCVSDLDDDDADHATPIVVGESASQLVWPDGDADFFRVADAGWYVLSAEVGADNDFDPVYTVSDAHTTRVLVGQPFFLGAGGVLSVADAGGGGDEDFTYTIRLDPWDGLVATPDGVDVPLAVGGFSLVGCVLDGGGTAVLRVLPEGTGALYAGSTGAASLTLLAPDGTRVGASAQSVWHPAVTAEPWRIEARDAGGYQSFDVITVSVSGALTGEVEPNDGPSAAEPVYDAVRGTFAAEGDEDWLLLESVADYLAVNCHHGGAVAAFETTLVLPDGTEEAFPASVTRYGTPRGTMLRVSGTGSGYEAWWSCTFGYTAPSSGDGD